jgi:hypothetical protein
MLPTAVLAVFLGAGSGQAIDIDVSQQDMEQVLTIARGTEAARDAFHAPYLLDTRDPTLDRLELITERRRLAFIAAERIAIGDPLFTRGTLRAEEALRPWRRKVAIAARLGFPVNNAYTIAPPVDVSLTGGPAQRLDLKSETLFAVPSTNPAQPVPVVGARGEALFDAVSLARASRTIVVRLGDREIARVAVDFSRID